MEEHTEKFFDSIVYPQGFTEFLNKFNSCEIEKSCGPKKVFIYGNSSNRSGAWGNYCELQDVYKFEDLIKINKDILLYTDDYYTQFRNIVLFADDESGHCQFLLDYGKGGEPSVKYLDNELDIIIQLANTFDEFEQKLYTASEAKKILKDKYYGFE
ncbi:MAG: SMI1/KNR4 family protein [Clostridia bacterium]|nr:SMI1/KNR4 family protein [Clostridia bacterium]